MICSTHQILFGRHNPEEYDGQYMWYMVAGGVHTGFCSEDLKEGADWIIWLRKSTGGGMLCMR